MLYGNENSAEFTILGKPCHIETNDLGDWVRVVWDDIDIGENFGADVWGDGYVHIHGAARVSAMEKALHEEAIDAIAVYIRWSHEYIKDLILEGEGSSLAV